MKQVKIVATIGPKTNNQQSLIALRDAGMNIARLNGSHSDFEWHEETIKLIRDTVPEIPILLDMPGRKIRTGKLKKDVSFQAGQNIILTTEPGHDGEIKIPLNSETIHTSLVVGDVILVDDATLRFKVLEVKDRDIICQAANSGTIRTAKGVNLPGIAYQSELVSKRDKELIEFACQNQVDFIGLSFVESTRQIDAVRRLIRGREVQIVSKIETQGGLNALDDIAANSDVVMIDRGDLSAETNLEHIALFQKDIICKARQAACPVIVATEMLHTMVHNLLPTKAEVSDITNAVLDGASAIMLSGETAIGQYPVEAVSLMRRVADATSEYMQRDHTNETEMRSGSVPEAMGEAIEQICKHLGITKIVAITISGYAARRVAARLTGHQILAVSNNPSAARRFNILPGTKGLYVDIPFSRTNMDHVPRCLEILWRNGELQDEDLILVTAVGYPKSGNRMNLIETHKVADLRISLNWEVA